MKFLTTLTAILCLNLISAQIIKFQNQEFDAVNVKASVVDFKGEKVLRIERDLDKIPFDENHLEATVDEPTFLKLKNLNFENGIIEVKVLAQIPEKNSFKASRGFIGVVYRINDDHSKFESIYLRPKNGVADNQVQRNHTVQYFSYPDYKFEKLRRPEYFGQYETYADIDLNQWITMKIEIKDQRATLYLNGQKNPSFIVGKMLGNQTSGSVGLRVDIATVAYFKDLKITKY